MTFPLHLLIVCQNGWKPETIGVNYIYIPEWEGLHFPGLTEEAVKIVVMSLVPLPSQASTRVKLERWAECGNERLFNRQSSPQAASLRCLHTTHVHPGGKVKEKAFFSNHVKVAFLGPLRALVVSAVELGTQWCGIWLMPQELKGRESEAASGRKQRAVVERNCVPPKACLRSLFLLLNQVESVGC